jgi:NADH pyrophosphatase NudC (nudix superfamily)
LVLPKHIRQLHLKVVWLGTDGDSGADLTLRDITDWTNNGDMRMIEYHHHLSHVSKQHQFCPKFGDKVPNFLQVQIQKVVWSII